MKLLIDECLPRTLKRLLGDHECPTVTGDRVVWNKEWRAAVIG
jgi:predicted nuclease of predicted toxin-antitoxin system